MAKTRVACFRLTPTKPMGKTAGIIFALFFYNQPRDSDQASGVSRFCKKVICLLAAQAQRVTVTQREREREREREENVISLRNAR